MADTIQAILNEVQSLRKEVAEMKTENAMLKEFIKVSIEGLSNAITGSENNIISEFGKAAPAKSSGKGKVSKPKQTTENGENLPTNKMFYFRKYYETVEDYRKDFRKKFSSTHAEVLEGIDKSSLIKPSVAQQLKNQAGQLWSYMKDHASTDPVIKGYQEAVQKEYELLKNSAKPADTQVKNENDTDDE